MLLLKGCFKTLGLLYPKYFQPLYGKRTCLGTRNKSQHLWLNFHKTLKQALLVINGADNVQEEIGKDNQMILKSRCCLKTR
jgi:hypothetical protein